MPKRFRKAGAVLLLTLLLSGALLSPEVRADDAELLRDLPGRWTCGDPAEGEGEETREMNLVMVLEEDGKITLDWSTPEGEPVLSRAGTWEAELVQGGSDRLTLRLNPAEDAAESTELIYGIYAEGWMEEDGLHQFLILERDGEDPVSPFQEIYGFDGIAFSRVRGPNMRVVRCKNYVSLRKDRSAKSARLAKVPLGAEVFAFPEFGEENGFILCNWKGKAGYILSEYLERMREESTADSGN